MDDICRRCISETVAIGHIPPALFDVLAYREFYITAMRWELFGDPSLKIG